MRKKRGALGHIEMMISFTLFVGFLLFIFIYFNPAKKSKLSGYDLEIVEKKILERITEEYNYTTVAITSGSGNCFSINFLNWNKVYVEDKNKIKTEAKIEGTQLYINQAPNNNFYYIYSHSGFPESDFDSGACKQLAETDYEIGAKRKIVAINEGKILNFNNSYRDIYEELKDELGINSEFGIIIKDSFGEEIININSGGKGAVLAKERGMDYFYDNGEHEFVILNIQIW